MTWPSWNFCPAHLSEWVGNGKQQSVPGRETHEIGVREAGQWSRGLGLPSGDVSGGGVSMGHLESRALGSVCPASAPDALAYLSQLLNIEESQAPQPGIKLRLISDFPVIPV